MFSLYTNPMLDTREEVVDHRDGKEKHSQLA